MLTRKLTREHILRGQVVALGPCGDKAPTVTSQARYSVNTSDVAKSRKRASDDLMEYNISRTYKAYKQVEIIITCNSIMPCLIITDTLLILF